MDWHAWGPVGGVIYNASAVMQNMSACVFQTEVWILLTYKLCDLEKAMGKNM